MSGRVSAFASVSKPQLRNSLQGDGGGGVPPTLITGENSLVLCVGSMAIAATLSPSTTPLTGALNEPLAAAVAVPTSLLPSPRLPVSTVERYTSTRQPAQAVPVTAVADAPASSG